MNHWSLEALVPAYGWLGAYRREDLRRDLSAGLAVVVVLVPQGMAYAVLAGLPPVHGLYASTGPAVVYALFGTSRHMPVGPPALMALLTFTGVSAVAEPGSGEYIAYALLLALMAGALQLALGLLRMGFVTNFIPRPVLSGFVYASAIIIVLAQAGSFLGIPVSGEESPLGTVAELSGSVGETNPFALAIGATGVVALVLLAKKFPRLPGSLLVAAGCAVAVYGLGLDGRGVEVVGGVPGGLPGFSVPPLDPGALRALAPAAVAVALVGFVESISVARAVAAREKYKIDSDAELRALGLANVCAGFLSGMPVAGSFSRTAVQYQSGARTQMASVVSAAGILLTLLFLTPLFYYLPDAALAAIVVVAVYGLLDFGEARRVFGVSRTDGYAMLLTFALTLLVGVEEGIIAGSLFALLAFVRRTAYPEVTELGYVPRKNAFLGLRSYSEARTYPEAIIVRFDARLYYANVPFLEEWLIEAVADRPRLRWIVIDCRGVNGIDVTAVEGLESLVSGYRSDGIRVVLTHAKLQVRERLESAGWPDKFGDLLYPTTRDALRDIGLLERRPPRSEPAEPLQPS
ncbi:MAG: Sulfate transporter family protein [uncultured Rubrobacteraceae bacterium]|uniref:Sulfate transporter family protein n=1 Tax=uncultured Rubrobacteraceae bacterium TaxID=349277 RepID=A0A6J4RBM4_9ACTN|nr:MAG: Sulfate transporter family protein [uncultured Rubrobacteraceae bacterium]